MDDDERSALASAADVVGDRWILRIVHVLLAGPARYGQLQEQVEGISTNVLGDRLRRLEESGLVVATPYQRRPVRHAYALTDRGRELGGALRLLAAWGGVRQGIRHAVCGTGLDAVWWCPTCDEVVDAAAATPDDGLVHL